MRHRLNPAARLTTVLSLPGRVLGFLLLLIVSLSPVSPLCAMPAATQTKHHAGMTMGCSPCCESPAGLTQSMACQPAHSQSAELLPAASPSHTPAQALLTLRTPAATRARSSMIAVADALPPAIRPPGVSVLRI